MLLAPSPDILLSAANMLYYINALTKHLAHISFTFKISLPLIRVIVASFLLYEYVYILYSIYPTSHCTCIVGAKASVAAH